MWSRIAFRALVLGTVLLAALMPAGSLSVVTSNARSAAAPALSPGMAPDASPLSSLVPVSIIATVTDSVWTGTPLALDGTPTTAKWGGAPSVALPHGRMYFRNDGDYLYVLIDVTGDTVNDPPLTAAPWGDLFMLSFDVNRDALISPNLDVNYGLHPGTFTLGLQSYLSANTWTGIRPTQSQLVAGFGPSPALATPHRIWELGIKLSEVQGLPGQVLRLGVETYSQNPAFDDLVPPGFTGNFASLIEVRLAQPRLAYIYSTDVATRDAYRALLVAARYQVDTILQSAIAATDFSPYSNILIGPETGNLDTWGDAAGNQARRVAEAGHAILGLGNGGYAFFGKLGLGIGWGNGAHDTGTSVYAVDTTDPVWSVPNPISIPASNIVRLYTAPTAEVAINNPTPVAGLTRIGQHVTSPAYYPIMRQYDKFVLWGFDAGPGAMTPIGARVLLNVLASLPLTPPRVAYIYNTDIAARDSFRALLATRGFLMDSVPITDSAVFDYSADRSIIIGNDTSSLTSWGAPAAVTHINAANRPIIGMGDGGYTFFGELGLDIGYPHGGFTGYSAARVVDPTQPIFNTPNPISIDTSGQVTLYTKAVIVDHIYVPGTPPAGVTLLGQEPRPRSFYYPLISQASKGHCYLLWGYFGSAAEMTPTGQDLFINALTAQPCGCSVRVTKSVAPTTASPGDILNYEIDYQFSGQCDCLDTTITDTLPLPDVRYLPGSAVPPATYAGGVLTWKLGDLPSGANGSVRFQAVVERAACDRQRVVINDALLTTSSPPISTRSNHVITEIICPPVDFPTNDPPYAESEITVNPYPLVVDQLTKLCTTIHNNSAAPQTVNVTFQLANFGIGLPFTTIAATGNPQQVTIPPGGSATVCILWRPTTPGHQCVQVIVEDAAQKFASMRSQRNLDVAERLVPGQPSTFSFPVGNQSRGTISVAMIVRNTCAGWLVSLSPQTFTLEALAQQMVNVTVTPPAGYPLGTDCMVDIEAWEVDQAGRPIRLIGGIRKLDRPQVPPGDPQEPPYAESEITIDPYPLISGQRTRACVTLFNHTAISQTITVEFQLSNLGIGLAFNRIAPIGSANPQTVLLLPHGSREICISFIPTEPGHHCMAVQLTSPDGYVAHSYRNLDIAERLQPGVATDVPIPVGNPTGATANIDLVVDNTCPGWTATVSPSTLYAVGPNDSDIRTVILTVTPPAGGLLGSGCHVDLKGYINGVLIGGIRKIDRPPVAPPIQEPHYAEREITVSPDPPVVGQPTYICATLTNPTDQNQTVNVSFAYADFGAGIPFTPIQAVNGIVIPANGSAPVCITWVPASGGTLHRCIRIQIYQNGYRDIYSQRNLNLRRLSAIVHLPFDLPTFIVHNPLPDPAPIVFDLRMLGLQGLGVDILDADTGGLINPGDPVPFGGSQDRRFFLRVRTAMMEGGERPESMSAADVVAGERGLIDVIPMLNGQPLTVDGLDSGVQFELGAPYTLYLPNVRK